MIGNTRAIHCKDCGIEKTAENTYVQYDKKSDTCRFNARCKECHKAHMKRHRATEEQYQMRRAYYQDNVEYYRELNRKQSRERHATPEFKIIAKMRGRVNRALSPDCRFLDRQIETIGCTPRFLRSYLESKFKEGMTWENRGRTGWHVDHIIPLSAFDLSDPNSTSIAFITQTCSRYGIGITSLKTTKYQSLCKSINGFNFLKTHLKPSPSACHPLTPNHPASAKPCERK